MSIETTRGTDLTAAEILGSAVERREDPALVTGDAEYTDDIQKHRLAHLAILRSQYAHATITDIDTTDATNHDGVIAVYTATDLENAGIANELPIKTLDEATPTSRPILNDKRARYQGDPIAAVVAEDRYTAHEALDRITVDYDRHDAVTDTVGTTAEDAPQLHDDIENNIAYRWDIGDKAKTDAAIDDAYETLDIEFLNQRLIPTAMEPRAAVATYNRSRNQLTVELTTQKPHEHRHDIAKTLNLPENKVRVRAPDIGGGFGSKIQRNSDEFLTAFAAMDLDRPVKWVATRSEGFQSTIHARDHVTTATLAIDEDDRIVGLRAHIHANLGAYLSTVGSNIPTNTGKMLPGQYDIPAVYCEIIGTLTNTTPVDAYRGAGRPEATYAIERIVSAAAQQLGVDPTEFRRKNFIQPEQFPHEVETGHVYDSGDYEKTLDKALEIVDYEGFRERQQTARERGRYLGIGFSCFVEACGSAPGRPESGLVRLHPSGAVTAYSGTCDHGQGLETSFAQILASELGVPYDDVEIVDGDTAGVPEGHGTSGSRSAAVGGSALVESAHKVIEQARRIAAYQFEAAEEDVEFDQGTFSVRGAPDRSMTIQEVARQAYNVDVPDDIEAGLEATTFYNPSNHTFPFGTHVAIVEVDPLTGETELSRYVAVDDVGNQVNPKIVEGQVHGGIAQGVGQALLEGAQYDENGNLVSGSLQDYAMPKAHSLPELETTHTITECPHNPLGVKGVGEAGTIAAPPAIVNAVVDALEPFGITHLDMPLTPERVWSHIQTGDTT